MNLKGEHLHGNLPAVLRTTLQAGPRGILAKANKLKTAWTWEEWQASRQARRSAVKRIGPSIVRRSESSSDRRLRAAFAGQRGPAFHGGQAQNYTKF